MSSSSISEFNLFLAERANLLPVPCCFCETPGTFYPTHVDQVLVCGACETCTAVMVDGFVPVESKGIPVITLDPLFTEVAEWCCPADFANGIFA